MNAKTALYNGKTVDIVEVKGGWTTVLDGMKQIKVRNSELTAAPVEGRAKPSRTKAVAAHDAAVKAEKAPKAKKAPLAPEDDQRLIKADLTRYVVTGEVKTASGRKAIDIADSVATQLRGADLTDAYRAASEATGLTQKALKAKYEHLNPGMQRMNLGNLIRGAASKAAREAAKEAKAS
jgi:hypothetical protein